MEVRQKRQRVVARWAREAFGELEARSLAQRALRLLEEAAEAAQACSVDLGTAISCLHIVYGKPTGDLSQELGGIGVTVLALADAAGLQADECERDEVGRILGKPIAYFRERNKAKNLAGLNAL